MLVTGARGFLAQVVARSAREAGWEVATAGRGQSGPGHWCCPEDRSAADLAAHLAEWQPQVIFHGAGSADVRASFADPLADMSASLGSWTRWLEAARLSGIQPLMIFPSSAAVYGSPEVLPVCESAHCRPISPYGYHKRLCEQAGQEYHAIFQVPVVILRLFSVFGPTQRRLLVHELYQLLCSQSDSLAIMGTGQETRDYILETDVGEAVLHVTSQAHLARTHTHPLVYNLASGREISVLSMATLLRDSLRDQRPIVCHGESRSGDPERWCADPSRFCNDHPGWRATPLEEAMAHTLQVWQSAPPEAIKP
jgi:UDP-glucose 4-epimerase